LSASSLRGAFERAIAVADRYDMIGRRVRHRSHEFGGGGRPA
jgi:hypothetical protein